VPTPGSSRRSRLGRFALASLIAAVICVGAVYQLGTELAPTFLKDLLIAAELGPFGARSLRPSTRGPMPRSSSTSLSLMVASGLRGPAY
jgi:hypothetical protein